MNDFLKPKLLGVISAAVCVIVLVGFIYVLYARITWLKSEIDIQKKVIAEQQIAVSLLQNEIKINEITANMLSKNHADTAAELEKMRSEISKSTSNLETLSRKISTMKPSPASPILLETIKGIQENRK